MSLKPMFVGKFFNVEESARLCSQLSDYIKIGNLGVGKQESISPGAIYVANYLPIVRAHIKMIPKVSEFVGRDVLPTFCMAQVYSKGAELLPHLDRHTCEVSLTTSFTPDFVWDIHTILGDDRQTFSMGCGDAVIYSGAKTTHYRKPLTAERYVQAAFHFVYADGDRAHLFYDRINMKE